MELEISCRIAQRAYICLELVVGTLRQGVELGLGIRALEQRP